MNQNTKLQRIHKNGTHKDTKTLIVITQIKIE